MALELEWLTSGSILFTGSIVLISGVLLGKMSYRFGLPLLLVFLLVGMGFGVDGLGIHFEDMETAQFVGMIALCVILFSGGLETKFSSIRPVMVQGLVLSTAGVLLTALLTGLFVWWLSGMSWTNIHFAFLPSLLLAATMSSTDSASVFGILGSQKVGLKENLRPMLELESGSNDPMAYMLTIILIETITLGNGLEVHDVLLQLGLQFVVGGAIGYGLGKGMVWLIHGYIHGFYTSIKQNSRLENKLDAIEEGLESVPVIGKTLKGGNTSAPDDDQASSMVSILAIGSAFLTFAVADMLKGNGYLAVYICGIVMGNAGVPYHRSLSRFVGGMSWLAQIGMFLMLGLLVNPHEMVDVVAVSLLIGAFMILVGRPASVLLCLLPFRHLSSRARIFVSWVGLRGAVPIIFATYPVLAEVEGSSQIFNIVFFVTLLSLLFQGTTIIALSKRLRLPEKPKFDDSDFGVEISESANTSLETLLIRQKHLENGDTLRDMHLPKGQLVMMVSRNGQHIVPNGSLHLKPGDALLIIKES